MEKILEKEIIKAFDNDTAIWLESDKCHFYTRKQIDSFIEENSKIIDESELIVNAGSSGESYGIPDEKTIHVDLVKDRIKHKPKYLTANIEKEIPIASSSVDMIFCVGSVINYTELIKVIQEFSRLSKNDGHLILEFECSNTLELLFNKNFNASATIINTFYRGEPSKIWYYSEQWVKNVLKNFGYEIVTVRRWHFISPLILKLTNNPNFSYVFSKLDPIVKWMPFLNRNCSNMILLAKKL